MGKFTSLLGVLCALAGAGNLQAQTYTPVAINGYNHDIVAEGGNPVQSTDTVLDATSHVMYSQAFAAAQGMSAGLPNDGLIADAANTYQFQLADYGAPNALTLMRGRSLTLPLTTPTAYARLSLLAFSTEGGSSISVTANLVNGSTVPLLTNAPLSDWFNATGNVVVSGFGRTTRVAGGPFPVDGLPGNPRFYHLDMAMPCASLLEPIASLSITNNTTSGSNAPYPNAVVLAVSGRSATELIGTSSTPSTCGQANGSASVAVTGNTGPWSYSWTSTSPVQTAPNAINLPAGIYPLVVTNTFGCSTSTQVTIIGTGSASVTATATPSTICSGGSSQLQVSASGGSITSATWNPGGLSGPTVTASPTTTTPYTATGTDNNGCSFSATVTVTVTPNVPPPAPTAAAATICAGQTASLAVQNPSPLYTYNWYSAASGGTALASGPSFTTSLLNSSTTYYVEAVLPCVTSTRTAVPVTVNPVPAAPGAAGATICVGNTATLTIQNPQTGLSYGWFADAAGSTQLGTGNAYTTAVLTTTTTFYVGATAGPCYPTTLSPVMVTATPLPSAPAAPPVSTCAGSAATLYVQNPDPSLTYRWYASATGGTVLFSNASYTTPALSSNTTYYVEAVSAGNCVSASRSAIPVTVNPAPAVPAAADVSICAGTTATLSVLSPQAGVTYSWYTAPNAGTLLFTGAVFTTPVLTNPATYYLEASIGSCINGRPPVQVDFRAQLPAPVVTGSIAGSSATFSWNAVPGAAGYEVSSDAGSTWTAPSSGPTGNTHVVSGLTPGVPALLQVRALASDPCANSPAATATALMSTDDVFVPNVFTPNADGRNDELMVYGSSIVTMDFRVFDQWGNEVFRSTDKSSGWPGTYRGQRAPLGVYVFALRAVLADGKVISKKGSVNLLR